MVPDSTRPQAAQLAGAPSGGGCPSSPAVSSPGAGGGCGAAAELEAEAVRLPAARAGRAEQTSRLPVAELEVEARAAPGGVAALRAELGGGPRQRRVAGAEGGGAAGVASSQAGGARATVSCRGCPSGYPQRRTG